MSESPDKAPQDKWAQVAEELVGLANAIPIEVEPFFESLAKANSVGSYIGRRIIIDGHIRQQSNERVRTHLLQVKERILKVLTQREYWDEVLGNICNHIVVTHERVADISSIEFEQLAHDDYPVQQLRKLSDFDARRYLLWVLHHESVFRAFDSLKTGLAMEIGDFSEPSLKDETEKQALPNPELSVNLQKAIFDHSFTFVDRMDLSALED